MCLNILSHFHKKYITGEVKGCYLGYTCLADMAHLLYSLRGLLQKSEDSAVYLSAAVRLPDTWRESTFSNAELDVCGVSYFYRTCAQP